MKLLHVNYLVELRRWEWLGRSEELYQLSTKCSAEKGRVGKTAHRCLWFSSDPWMFTGTSCLWPQNGRGANLYKRYSYIPGIVLWWAESAVCIFYVSGCRDLCGSFICLSIFIWLNFTIMILRENDSQMLDRACVIWLRLCTQTISYSYTAASLSCVLL